MNIDIKKRDIIWSYLGMALTMEVNLLLLPLYVYFFTDNTIGLWYVFISLGGIALLFDFGFSITFARNITYCWSGAKTLQKTDVSIAESKGVNYPLLKSVISVCRWIYGILAGVALVLIMTGGMAYVGALVGFTADPVPYIAWGAYGLGIVLNLYYSYYIAFLRGIGDITEANKSIVYARLLQLVVTIGLLMAGGGIIGASVGYLVYGLGFKLFGERYFYRYQQLGAHLDAVLPDPSVQRGDLFRTIWYNAWRDGIVSIANYGSTQATILLCSLYVSLAETGLYSIAVQLTTAVAVVSSTLYNTYQPAFQNAYITGDTKRLRQLFSMAVTIFVVLYIIGTIALWAVTPILGLIKPSMNLSTQLLWGTAAMQFIIYFRNCYTSYFSCTNRILYVQAFIISAIGGLILSAVLMGYFNCGIWGLIGGTVLSQLVYNSWFWLVKANREMGLSIVSMLSIGLGALKDKLHRKP